ncbi:MAG: glycosyltransferase [Prevotella sp.]|nr:glycosyltransferase [Prevotella sp.]
MNYAPIALFTYNRADHTQQTVESLLKNKEAVESDLYIFSDGPKNEDKRKAVEENRAYIRSIAGGKSIHIIEREKNWGLAKSLIAGITEIVNKYGRVIVVEDDLILSPYFLKFMNEALDKYADDDRVSAVSAFLNPIDCKAPETFFLRYFACWGWATWDRAWSLFNPNTKELLKHIRWKTKDFNIGQGGGGGFYGMLYCHKVGLVDSWAVRFYASSFLANKLVLYPGESLALQSGMDGTGTHSDNSPHKYDMMELSARPISITDIPVCENKEIFAAYARYYRGGKEKSIKFFYGQLKSFIRRLMGIDYR